MKKIKSSRKSIRSAACYPQNTPQDVSSDDGKLIKKGTPFEVVYDRKEGDEYVLTIKVAGIGQTGLRFNSEEEARKEGWIVSSRKSIKSNKITQSKERSIMNGAIKELEELFSTKAKGNTVYFNDVNYTPLPLPVQNAVKAIMEEYPDMKYRIGLYSVTVLEKGEAIKSSRKVRKIQSRRTYKNKISSSGAFRDRDEDDNPECIIEIKKDGKWEGVGIDKNSDDGWSTNVNFTVFESEDKARKSGMARRLKNAGYSEEDGTLKFSTK